MTFLSINLKTLKGNLLYKQLKTKQQPERMTSNIEKIDEITCVICFETTKDIRKNACNVIKCYTCADGFVCNDCIPEIDPEGSIFCNSEEDVIRAIKCPCCRNLNWNYHYNQIVGIELGYNLYDLGSETNPALELFFKNYKEAKGYTDDTDDDDTDDDDTDDEE